MIYIHQIFYINSEINSFSRRQAGPLRLGIEPAVEDVLEHLEPSVRLLRDGQEGGEPST